MTKSNKYYHAAKSALEEADALVAETDANLAEAEFEAEQEEAEKTLAEIDRGLDLLDRLIEAEDFSDKISSQFPELAAKSREELEQLKNEQWEKSLKLQDVWIKKQEAYQNAIGTEAELACEKELTKANKEHLQAKRLYSACEILLSSLDLYDALEKLNDSDKESKLEAEAALLYKEIDIHSAKMDEYMAQIDESTDFFDSVIKEQDLINEKFNRLEKIIEEITAISQD